MGFFERLSVRGKVMGGFAVVIHAQELKKLSSTHLPNHL